MLEQRFQEELVRWEEQLKIRKEHGDQLDQVRIMEHFCYFKNGKSAQQAAEVLSEIDYKCEISKVGLFKVLLIARRDDDIDEEYFTTIKAVIAVVDSFGGVYDGNGGQIVEA